MRITSLDALRGIAILGILFMNIPFHANIFLGYVPFEPMLASDKLITLFYSIFADGRFRTLFCLLFGAGLAIQYESCIRKGIDTTIFLKSRLKWLLLFGFIHGVFIFGGDILMMYSLAGLMLIKGLSLETQVLLKKSGKFIIIGSSAMLIFSIIEFLYLDSIGLIVRGSEEYLNTNELWQGNFVYQTLINAGFSIGLLILSPLYIFWQVLGLMYLGSYLNRVGFFTQGFSRAVFKKISVLAVVSTALCISPQLVISDGANPLLSSLSAIFVALVYAHIVVKLCQSKNIIMNVFSATGKIALSLYILQSIAMAILLRYLIPEFNLTATHLDYLLITLTFSVIQIVIACLYSRMNKQGPLEWLWRTLYKKTIQKKLQKKEI